MVSKFSVPWVNWRVRMGTIHTLIGLVLSDLFPPANPHFLISPASPKMPSDDKPLRYSLSVSEPSLSSRFSMHGSTKWELSLPTNETLDGYFGSKPQKIPRTAFCVTIENYLAPNARKCQG